MLPYVENKVYLLANEGFTEQIKTGFLYCLLGSERPINEMLNPNLQDQQSALSKQFEGMASEVLSYDEYEKVRLELVELIRQSLTAGDKDFLLNFKNLTPVWEKYNYADFHQFDGKCKIWRNLRK